jgi:hypothetical protein
MKRGIFAVAFCLLLSTFMLGQTGSQQNTKTIQPIETDVGILFQTPSGLPLGYPSGGQGFVFVSRFYLPYQNPQYQPTCGPAPYTCTVLFYSFCSGGEAPCFEGEGFINDSQFRGTPGPSYHSKNVLTLDADTSNLPPGFFENILCSNPQYGPYADECTEYTEAGGGLIQINLQQTSAYYSMQDDHYKSVVFCPQPLCSVTEQGIFLSEYINNQFSANVSGTVLGAPLSTLVTLLNTPYPNISFQEIITQDKPIPAAVAVKIVQRPSEIARRQGWPEAVVRRLERMESKLQEREALQK